MHGVLHSDPMYLLAIRHVAGSLLSEVLGERSPNTEGEDELLRCALETVVKGISFLALVDDIDFRAACLVTLSALLFVDGGVQPPIGRLFYAKPERSRPEAMEFWCMNDMLIGITHHPMLVQAIPGGPPPLVRTEAVACRLRCAYVAATMVLLGGDTTPPIVNVNEELGLRLAIEHASYVCSVGLLVFPELHQPSGTEVYRLQREAVMRLHTIWYIHRRTPNIGLV